MQTYVIQATAAGWTMFRAAGVTQNFRSLAVAKMLVEDTGARLIVLDRNGYPMGVAH